MKLAIMQPYLFPYIGYFQLVNTVDKFVVYDDVNYIKQGWINRNQILVQGKSFMFTVPLNKASSFSKINEIFINDAKISQWKSKFLQTLEQSYRKAPYFEPSFELIKRIFNEETIDSRISTLAAHSIIEVCNYLNITTEFVPSSSAYQNSVLSGQERVIDICLKEQATQYINPIGGQELYQSDVFQHNGVRLNFIKSSEVKYQQHKAEFIPWLSIIDVLMFNAPHEIHQLLNKYELT